MNSLITIDYCIPRRVSRILITFALIVSNCVLADTPNVLNTSEWRIFVERAEELSISPIDRSTLEAKCLAAISTDGNLTNIESVPVCIDAAVKTISPFAWYRDINTHNIQAKTTASSESLKPKNIKAISNEIVYLQFTSFEVNAFKNAIAAINELHEKNTIQGLVIDLRDNNGGGFVQIEEVAALFMQEGKVLGNVFGKRPYQSKATKPRAGFFTSTQFPPSLLTAPITVIVNKNTSAGAELLANALKIHRAAFLIGEKTMGLNHSFITLPLTRPSYILLLPAGKMSGPHGESWSPNGLKIDMDLTNLTSTNESDEWINSAVKILKSKK
jgi:hypothetical protein